METVTKTSVVLLEAAAEETPVESSRGVDELTPVPASISMTSEEEIDTYLKQ